MTAPPARADRPRSRPVTRWVVLVALLGGLLASLGVDGLLAAAPGGRTVGEPVLDEGDELGPVVEVGDTSVWSAPGTPGTVGIALVATDGGRRSTHGWAGAAEVLDRHGVDATWFVSGRTVLDDPGRIGAVRDAGHEIGITGFSGRDLAGLAGWRARLELSGAQAALTARTGITTALLVVPSSPTRATLDDDAVQVARTAGRLGYSLVVGTDPADAGPGDVAVIPLGRGAPAQLDALLARLDAEGVRAVPVSEAAGIDPDTVNAAAGSGARLHARAFVAAVRASSAVGGFVDRLFVPLAVVMAARAAVAIVLARVHARRRRPPRDRWRGPVSVVVPAYNEAEGIEATLRSLVASDWPYGLEVVVVDDGSTDGTASIVAGLQLPGVRLVRQPNQGKPAALNTGLGLVSSEIVVMIDGDTVVEPGTIAALVAPFTDPRVGASSGNAKVGNRGSLLGRWQHIEYVMGFNLDRRMLAVLGAVTTVPGAAGAFRTAALRQVGGLSDDTIAEDTDLTIALQRARWRIVYESGAIAWTEAPSTVGDLWRQRYRWCYGTLQSVWKHRRAVIEGRSIGLIGLPYALVFQVVVALVAPVVDVAALYGLVTGRAGEVAAAWLGFSLAQLLLAAVAMWLDRESLRPLWAVPLQQVAYRQLMYLVVIQSVAAACSGTRLRWHKLRRVGIATTPGPAAATAAATWPAATAPAGTTGARPRRGRGGYERER